MCVHASAAAEPKKRALIEDNGDESTDAVCLREWQRVTEP